MVGYAVAEFAKLIEPGVDLRRLEPVGNACCRCGCQMSGALRELVIDTQNPNVSSAITFPGGALGPPAALRAFSRSAWVRVAFGNSRATDRVSVQWLSPWM